MTELTDEEIEAIDEDAQDAAIHAYGPLGSPTRRPNPWARGTEQHDLWEQRFFNHLARENGY